MLEVIRLSTTRSKRQKNCLPKRPNAENSEQATWAVSDQQDNELTKIELSEGDIQQIKMQADMLVEQGDLDETQSLYDEALTAYNEALEIYSKIQDARGIIKVYLRIANIHYHVGNLEMSRKGCIDALTLAESIDSTISKRTYLFKLVN